MRIFPVGNQSVLATVFFFVRSITSWYQIENFYVFIVKKMCSRSC